MTLSPAIAEPPDDPCDGHETEGPCASGSTNNGNSVGTGNDPNDPVANNEGGGGTATGGEGGGSQQDEKTRACMQEQTDEKIRDELAREISEIIKSKRDWKTREYGAVIIRTNDDKYRITEIFSGTATDVDYEFSMFTGERIVGSVHNHAAENYNNSSGPSGDDWKGASDWVNLDLALSDFYAEYLLSSSGNLAEFDYDKDYGKNEAKPSDRKDAQSSC